MPRASSHSLARLPQVAETWLIATTQLRLWLTPPGAAPHRPYLIFIVSMDTGMIRGHDLVDSEPAPGDVRKALVQAMQSPPPGLGEPCRPKGVAVAVAAQAEALAQFFAAGRVEIDVFEAPVPDEVWQIVRELEEHMRGGPEHPGYLSLKGVTPELAGGFYTAAADYYRAAPWVRLSNYQVLALRHPAERAYRYIIVMGQGGIEYGLAVYRRWQDVERMFTDDEPPIRMMPAGGVHSFSFETIDKVPFDDLEAQQRHGWEVAAANAYPLAFIIDKGGVVRRPSAADLRWYEAALRAIPRLVRDDLKADGRGDYLPLETTLTVPTHAGEIEVAVKYPAGKLQLAEQPSQRMDWSGAKDDAGGPPFDFRAVEGAMYQMAAGMGAQAGKHDRKLDRAQEMMYRAWEESNPSKRIALAHDALGLSPDCADAYVLLAEEEAATVSQAMDYYRQGIEAGERVLGRGYFEANAGYFWGLLETRPYMRARLGLANALGQLHRFDEAIVEFRELLRLNPGDNQGVRYLWLGLLQHLERDEEVGQLLGAYPDEWSAAWLYSRALHAFRRGGASAQANKALREALKENKHVPAYLTGEKRIPNSLPQLIGFGDEDEAVAYAAEHLNDWRRTPSAVEWLSAQRPPARSASAPRRKRKGR